jgi:hypothetical protein
MASKKLILTLTCVTALAILAVGCGSDDDSSPAAPVVDTAPPAIASGVEVVYSRQHEGVKVSWDPNATDSDFAGFVLSRAVDGAQAIELIESPQDVTEYWDLELGELGCQAATYLVYAVDAAGNMSAASSVTFEVPEDDPGVSDTERRAL